MTIPHNSDILLVLPPLAQPNTVYPSITHLSAFLRAKGFNAIPYDLSIHLLDSLLTKSAVTKIFDSAERLHLPKNIKILLSNRDFYINNVEVAKDFLRGNCPELATRLASLDFWENMQRLPEIEDLEWDYGSAGTTDRAKYLCSLFLKNLCDVINVIDPNFQLIRYAEHLSTYLETFSPIEEALNQEPNIVSDTTISLMDSLIQKHRPKFIGFSIPFPGNLLGAMQCAKFIRSNYPDTKIIMGGGYVNTELRQISDTSIFRYIDYLVFDDGEAPLLNILNGNDLIRTATFSDGKIIFHNMDSTETGSIYSLPEIPDLSFGIDYSKYFNFVDSANPMHRLWSDGRWHKLMLAHGCYWHKCAFCDTKLDYIGNFRPYEAKKIVDIMEYLAETTGIRGFHFIDEAAPPALLRSLAEEIISRKLVVSYWTNIRFDKTFTPELCFLLAKSGCIAVSGGLEVASPRVLKLINKGVTLESATECMRNLHANSIMVHAYLMYGFPTQTVAELYDSLAKVRDLFAEDLVQSAFWHRYAMTVHSPSGSNPADYNAKRLDSKPNPFANNEVPFSEPNQPDWAKFHHGLEIATYNFMRQTGFDLPVKNWFK